MSISASTQANRARRRLLAAFEDDYAPGDRLPSERDLCELTEASRRILRSVLAQFEDEGVVSLAGRKRFFVGKEGKPRVVSPWRNVVILYSFGPAPSPEAPEIYHPDIINTHAMARLREHGYDALFLNGFERLQETIRSTEATPPAGVVCGEVSPGVNEGLRPLVAELQALRACGVPVLVIGNDPGVREFDRVTSDQCVGVSKLMSWLAERGCRRIVPFWSAPGPTDWVPMRDSAYQLAAGDLGLTPLPSPFRTLDAERRNLTRQNAADVFVRLLEPFLTSPEPADAILVRDDGYLTAAAAACRRLGRRPGDDILLAGYDNTWRAFDVDAPPAVTIDKDYCGEGRELANLLHERLTGQLPETPQIRWVPPQLVVPGRADADTRYEQQALSRGV